MNIKSVLVTLGLIVCVSLNGCGLALWSTAGIPATEYVAHEKYEASGPIAMGLVAAHGGITYLLWGTCWPAAIAYLGASGIYTIVRVVVEEERN